MKIIVTLSICSFLWYGAFAQKTIPLYESGQIPNAKSTPIEETVQTWQDGETTIRFIQNISTPDLTIYLPQGEKNTGIAVIICPGGGYAGLAIDHEGHDIAKKLNEQGVAGFVLKNRLPDPKIVDNKEVVPLQDAQRAIQIVRENAKEWNLDPNKIGIAGSSAGGHLASTAGTHFQKILIDNPKETSLRPDFMVLNYPVISFADSLTHGGSRDNLIGGMNGEELKEEMIVEYSNELQVTEATPPTFITHAVDDEVVKVQNSLVFIAALQQKNIPVESFFYAKGGHGFGMYNSTAEVDWIDACINWLLAINQGK